MGDTGNTNIILAGFMATGKTTVGKKLALRIGRSFIDTDRVVEDMTGLKIDQIFEQFGEPYFRELESEIITGLDRYPAGSLVVATGGGVLLSEANRIRLKKTGLLILLTASPHDIMKRSGKTGIRPLLKGPDIPGKIKKLLEERRQYYNCCDLSIDTSGKTASQIVREIEEKLKL